MLFFLPALWAVVVSIVLSNQSDEKPAPIVSPPPATREVIRELEPAQMYTLQEEQLIQDTLEILAEEL